MICKKLENLVQVLRTDESMDVVWSDWWVLPSEQMKQKLTEANRIASAAPAPAWQVTDQPIPSELWPALFRRRFLAASKRWNEIADREEDWEYSLRLLAANPKRGHLPQVLCIQRLHQSVHRMAYTHLANPVAGALVTAREAARARQTSSVPNPRVDQMVADYFWERFLEALQLGTRPLAAEAIRGACRWGHRPPFRIKTRVCQILLKVLGTKATLALLRSRYCRNS